MEPAANSFIACNRGGDKGIVCRSGQAHVLPGWWPYLAFDLELGRKRWYSERCPEVLCRGGLASQPECAPNRQPMLTNPLYALNFVGIGSHLFRCDAGAALASATTGTR